MQPRMTGGSHRRTHRLRPWRGALLVVFTLLASTVGAEAEPSVGPFVSDDFSAAALGAHWEKVTPHGVGVVQVVGGGTNGLLALSVPAGVNHDPWRTNDSVRAVQAVRDGDLSVEAGFVSLPFARYQMQGLVVAGSTTTFLRYEVHHDGAGLRLFASVTVDGSPTVTVDVELPQVDVPSQRDVVYLRVERHGDDWTLSWSADGTSWSVGAQFVHPMAVAEVGPFVGSYDPAGNAPAFTALVDYVVGPAGSGASAAVPVAGTPPGSAAAAPPAVTGVVADLRAESSRVTWVTDELTTGMVEYGTTDSYGQQSAVTAPGFDHGVTIRGLTPGTSYHYRIVATDTSGNSTTSPDKVFTTSDDTGEDPLQSDDFAGETLGPQWTPVRSLGLGRVSRAGPGDADDQLALSVPAGYRHHPWTANDSVRAVQPVPDGDLTVEAGFVSMPSERYQMQGLTVAESRITFLRYEVHHDGAGLQLFASVTVDGRPTKVLDMALPELEAVHLEVGRYGDEWTLSWSRDGTSWSSVAAFTQRMVVAEVGPFAASYSETGDAPAFTALVDYVTGSGSDPDGANAGPLAVRDLSVDTSTNGVVVSWVTSRTAAARVEYGADDSYGATSAATAPGTLHSVLLPDLDLGTTYHYRVVATDPADEQVATGDDTFTTAAVDTGPTIDFWYGQDQRFGPPTEGQIWVNLLGNVSDRDGVASLTYALNGGGPRTLTIGPDERRLQWPGDFNADIAVDELQPGRNTVTFTAADTAGRITTRTVTVQRRTGDGAVLPYTIQWRPGVSVASQAQVVDGRWTVTDDGVRTVETGYDRLIALGDVGWSDYELTVPITVHEIGPAAYTRLSNAPVIGLGLRWDGHTASGTDQPAWEWYPSGAFAWYRFYENGPRLELSGNNGAPRSYASPFFEIGETYLLKARVETLDGGGTRYRVALWPEDGAEPGFWDVEIEDAGGPASGAVVLIAHQLDGTFGDVTIEPLSSGVAASS